MTLPPTTYGHCGGKAGAPAAPAQLRHRRQSRSGWAFNVSAGGAGGQRAGTRRQACDARHWSRDAPVDGPQVGAAAGADKHAVLEVLAAEAIRISASLRLGVGVAGEGSGGVVQQMCGGGAIAAAAALRLPCTQAARRLLGPEGRVLVLACSCMLLDIL